MSNATASLGIEVTGGPGVQVSLPVKGSTSIYKGTLVSQNSSGYVLPYSASGALCAIGVAQHDQSNASGSDGDKRVIVELKRIYCFTNGSGGDAFSDTSRIGAVVYATDDHTVADNSSTYTRKPVGFFMGFESDSTVRVFVDPVAAKIVEVLQSLGTLTDSPANADALRDELVAAAAGLG